jgi:hypothetical protein
MMRYISLFLTLAAAGCARVVPSTVPDLPGLPESKEAPAAFDSASNGVVDDATHQADRTAFEQVEEISDGLGPLYNAQSCRECHQNPASGGGSQVAELRAGHRDPHTFSAGFASACKAAGIPVFHAGQLRHSVATWAVNSGADPESVAAFLG